MLYTGYDTDLMDFNDNAGLMEVDEKVVLPTNTPIVQGMLIS